MLFPCLVSDSYLHISIMQIAKDIKKNYEEFDGFVILHGTDTLAYTSSALSFMLENLGKPVIVTGSQIPSFETRWIFIFNVTVCVSSFVLLLPGVMAERTLSGL